jgi:hypothetical protein
LRQCAPPPAHRTDASSDDGTTAETCRIAATTAATLRIRIIDRFEFTSKKVVLHV